MHFIRRYKRLKLLFSRLCFVTGFGQWGVTELRGWRAACYGMDRRVLHGQSFHPKGSCDNPDNREFVILIYFSLAPGSSATRIEAWKGRILRFNCRQRGGDEYAILSHYATPKAEKLVSKSKPTAESAAAPADIPFPEWLQHRLRLGLTDDCVILFIPSHSPYRSPGKNQ